MNSFDLVLFISRLSGIAPYVKSHNSRYTKSKAWRWYSLVLCLLVSVGNIISAWFYVFIDDEKHAWFLVAAIPFYVMCTIGMIASIARNQISLLGELLDTLQPAFSRRTYRWLLPELSIVLIGEVMNVVVFGRPRYEGGFLSNMTDLQLFCTRHLLIMECCLFGVLTLRLANKYAAINDNLRAAMLGPTAGQRYVAPYDKIISLRKQHREIGQIMDRLWAVFHAPVTLSLMECCIMFITYSATVITNKSDRRPLEAAGHFAVRLIATVLAIMAGDSNASEGNKTLDVVHEYLNKDNLSAAEMEELIVFAMSVFQRPVHIRMMGFISIELTLLIKAVGASVSLILICLQFQ